MRHPVLILAFALACGAPEAPPPSSADAIAAAQVPDVRGFVISKWGYAVPPEEPGDCPDGMNVTEREFYVDEFEEVRDAVKRRFEAGDREGAESLMPADTCKDPNILPDPGHKTLDGPALVQGIDLDGVDSSVAQGGSCTHDDFTSPDGRSGIDNQYWRLMGCVGAFRPDRLYERMYESGEAVKDGSYSELIEITLLDGTRENGRVEVRMFSGAGSVTTDANGDVMVDTSQLVHEDTAYHSATFEGDIRDGLLTAGPFDLRMRFKAQAIDNEYVFRDARIRAKILPDGSMDGVLAGYWPIDAVFDFMTEVYFGPFHFGRTAAQAIGYMCGGVYHALPRVADGHPDPETGNCTSVSTSMQFAAVPAFVIQQ